MAPLFFSVHATILIDMLKNKNNYLNIIKQYLLEVYKPHIQADDTFVGIYIVPQRDPYPWIPHSKKNIVLHKIDISTQYCSSSWQLFRVSYIFTSNQKKLSTSITSMLYAFHMGDFQWSTRETLIFSRKEILHLWERIFCIPATNSNYLIDSIRSNSFK